MQWGPQISPFRGVSAWTPKVQVTHINKYFWRKQPRSTEGFHTWPCKYEHRIRLTDYAKGEKSELLPQSVHVFLERCFGSLETLENSWFSLLGMVKREDDGQPRTTDPHSPGYHYRGPHSCLIHPRAFPPQTPNGVCWAQSNPQGETFCLNALETGKKSERRDELYLFTAGEAD